MSYSVGVIMVVIPVLQFPKPSFSINCSVLAQLKLFIIVIAAGAFLTVDVGLSQ